MVELAAGYPAMLYRGIGHPVTWIGTLLISLERVLYPLGSAAKWRYAAGILAVAVLIAATTIPAYALEVLLAPSLIGLVALTLITATLLTPGSLAHHVNDVAVALETGDVEAARAEVAHIVGRDTANLDEAAIARAAIESLSENFSDGTIAPAFWFLLLGLPGAAAYKAINTADSMIGHRTQRYRQFGWAAARLDDLVNLPASRLTSALIALSALMTPSADGLKAISTAKRDASRHRSPNAGWPEAAMAGALGLSLGGARTYKGQRVDDATMGDGRRDATAQDIRRALTLYNTAVIIFLGALCGFAAPLILNAQV